MIKSLSIEQAPFVISKTHHSRCAMVISVVDMVRVGIGVYIRVSLGALVRDKISGFVEAFARILAISAKMSHE